MFETETLMTLIPALPLLSAIVIGVFGKKVLKERSHWPCVAAIAGAFVCACMLLFEVKSLDTPAEDEHAPAASSEKGGAEKVGIEKTHVLWTWADVKDAYHPPKPASGPMLAPAVADFNLEITLRADPLTCIMLCMVTFIATLVAIYASGYMHGDPGYWRFFAYVSLFVFSMTMLVSVSNFALLYVIREAVGVSS